MRKTTDDKLAEKEEAELLSLLRGEAYAFIPDRLSSVLRSCGVIGSDGQNGEKNEIIAAIRGEPFAPNLLPSIEKEIGIFDPFRNHYAIALTEKMRNEGRDIVPNVKKQVYERTGLRPRFSLRHPLDGRLIAFGLLGTIGLGLGSAALLSGLSAEPVAASYITVSVTPASFAAVESESQSSSSGFSPNAINGFQPSWGFAADETNIVTSFSYANRSAWLALQSGTFAPVGKNACEAIPDLIPPAHANGYLETDDKTKRNIIRISVFTTDDSYEAKYSANYAEALDAALRSADNRIYARIYFSAQAIDGRNLRGFAKEPGLPIGLYSAFCDNDGSVGLTLEEIEEGKMDVLRPLRDAVDAGQRAKLSDMALRGLKRGLAESYRLYLNPTKPNATEEEVAAWRAELKEASGSIPWLRGDDALSLIDQDAYYIMGGDIGFGGTETWGLYAKIRDYVLKKRTADQTSYIAYLKEIGELAEKGQESTGYLPDAPTGIDMGGHSPGGGPNAGDWGEGGGEWMG